MKVFLLWLCLAAALLASDGFVSLTSADGQKTMVAKPIGVTGAAGEKICFLKKGGSEFVASLDRFSPSDRQHLSEWSVAMRKHPHRALVVRVKKAKKLRVLFIGNSYSFYIPQQFEKLAQAEGKKVEVGQMTNGGWILQQHADSQKTLDAIAKDEGGKWDIVVLQEQSQLPAIAEPERCQMMDPAVKLLASAVREAGAIPVFFQTWGRKNGDGVNESYAAMQKHLIQGYQKAAIAAGGAWVVPVGEVWAEVRKQGKDAGLYAEDGSHPASGGNYLGACVFYSAFYDAAVTQPQRNVPEATALSKAARLARLKPLPYPLPQ